jgi:LmbE family N-acetylglucosaminyl deacetylase
MADKTKKAEKPETPPREYRSVLVVVAHPDDPEFLFGATAAMLANEGADVRYVICSDGANGSRDCGLSNSEVAAIRMQEQRQAAATLGVCDVIFLGFPDGGLFPGPDLRAAIAREVRRFKPDLVLTHFPHRVLDIPIDASHPDHIAVGESVLAAIFPDASNPRALPQLRREGLEPHRVKEIWLTGYERANHFVDAAPFIEKKAKAILCHKSQLNGSSSVPPWVYDWMKWSGREAGFQYAESYKRIEL